MPTRRATALFLLAVAACVALQTPAFARAEWKVRVDRAIGGRSVGVSVRVDGRNIYRHRDRQRRVPASNQKLLLSMALLDELGPNFRFRTIAAGSLQLGVVQGNLWILGRGDPTVTGGGKYKKTLPFRPTKLGRFARSIKRAGVTKVDGSVMGSTGYFARDWYAPGWKPSFPVEEVPLPSALTFNGNESGDDHIADPERRVAASLTKKLRSIGVKVAGPPGAGEPPVKLDRIAAIRSRLLTRMMTYMNRRSSNFFAEVFGKRLGLERFGAPGTIAKGARAIRTWAAAHEVELFSYDSSGLSYSDRASPRGIARLLDVVEDEPWGKELRATLPGPDQGTLEDRLRGVRVRAKTGTLTNISTLSGWVYMERVDRWANFSIMSDGMSKATAAAIEDRIVRILASYART